MQALAETKAKPSILTQEVLRSANPGEAIASTLVDVTNTNTAPLEGFLIMLHSASSKRAAEICREQIEAHHQEAMNAVLEGALVPQRAALTFALIAGFQLMRQTIGLTALVEGEPDDLVRILGPLFQQLVEG